MDTRQGYAIDRGEPGGWDLQEVHGPGDEGLVRCMIARSFGENHGLMFGISGKFELEIFVGCADWSFPEGGFFNLRMQIDDQPAYDVFATTANPTSMLVIAPQKMEFFEALKHGTYLTFSAIDTEGEENVYLNSTGEEEFSIILRNTAEALDALYECARAAVPPAVAERSFHTSDMLNDQGENDDSMVRMLAEVTELTSDKAGGSRSGTTQESGNEESGPETAEAEGGSRLLNMLLQASINNSATDLKDFEIDIGQLDEVDRQGRELTWTVGDIKGTGLEMPMGSRTVADLFSEFVKECRQRCKDELVMKELPGLVFPFGAMSQSRVVRCFAPGKEFTAVCSLVPAGRVMFRITHDVDGLSDGPVDADARLISTLQAMIEAFREQAE
ncbi:MAG: hypothetical protein RIM72_06620 [Alphaproteobacteria bacterium]